MKRLRKISEKYSWLTLVLGIIVGSYILAPQAETNEEVCADQTEQNSQSQEVVGEQSPEALNVNAQGSVERNSYLIEVILGVDQVEDVSADLNVYLPSPSKVFKIVFEHIISPNSP